MLESAANFVFARHAERGGAELALALRKQAILVRHFPAERTRDFLRISIGTDAECDRLVEVLREILG